MLGQINLSKTPHLSRDHLSVVDKIIPSVEVQRTLILSVATPVLKIKDITDFAPKIFVIKL